jgi:hypothetical protein
MFSANMTIQNPMLNEYLLYQAMGYRFIENPHMVDKIQNRTHRKSRINKKWANRYGYTIIPKKNVYVSGHNIIGHPSAIKALKSK